MKNGKRLVVAALLLGAAIALRDPGQRPTLALLARIFPGSTVDPEGARDILSGLSRPEARKELRRAYLRVSLSEPGEETKRGLATMAQGLSSVDEEVRRQSARYVESLLVDLAHGEATVHPDNQSELRELVSLYKKRAPEQIQRMRQAFPGSPTLALLRNI